MLEHKDKRTDSKFVNKVYPILFPPDGSRPLTQTYPELKEVPEFVDILPSDLRFVWCYTILYNNVKIEKERIQLSIAEAYGKRIDEDYKQKLINGNWTPKMRSAIARMSTYDLSVRLKNRRMVEQIHKKYQDILDKYDNSQMESIDEEKKYVDLSADIIKNMPLLMSRIEDGYGVNDITIATRENAGNLINGFYNTIKEGENTKTDGEASE